MKRAYGFFTAFFALFLATAACAQNAGIVSNHSVPIGKGPGVTGYSSAAPGAAGNIVTSNGPSSDPAFQPSPSGLNVYAFGAVGNGVTDDTTALTNAFAAAALVAGQVTLPCGTFLISGVGSQIFNLAVPIRVIGSGVCTTFLIKSTVPTATDIFHLVANAANPSGWAFQNFQVLVQSGAPGRHLFHLESSTTAVFSQPTISGITQASALNGFSVYINNNAGNTQGGTVRPQIGPNNLFKNPVQIVLGGDSIAILNNTITSSTVGVYASLTGGAGNLQVAGNNVTSTAGCIVIDSGVLPVLLNNVCEQTGTNTEVNNAIVDLNGGVAQIDGALISGNMIQVISGSGTGNPIPLRIGAVGAASAKGGAAVIGNRFGILSAYAPVVITASANQTAIGPGNTCPICSGGVLAISNSGSGTTQSPVIGTSPTAFGVITSTGGNGLTATAAMTNGQILVGQTGAAPLPQTVSGDATLAASGALTLASTIAAGGPIGSATVAPIITYDAKGRLTAVSSATVTPAVGSITGLGTGVPTALGVNVGTAGAPVINGGALGTPSSGIGTNLTGIPTSALTGALLAAQEPAHTGDMTNSAGSLATTVTKINGADQTTAWAAYTPTLSCGSGTLTTSSATGAFKQIGKTTFVRFAASITTNGTCAGSLVVTLPAAPVSGQDMMIAVRDVTNGQMGAGRINSALGTSATITRSDGVYMPVSGSLIVGTGVYEAN